MRILLRAAGAVVCLGLAVLAAVAVTGIPAGVGGKADPGPRLGEAVPSGGEPRAGATVLRKREGSVVPPDGPSAADWLVHRSVLSAREAAPIRDGWVVLDDRSRHLHFLDSGLGVVRSVGGRGGGPGELEWPLHLAVLSDSLVAVLDASGTRIDVFSAGGAFMDRIIPRVPGCPAGLSRDLVPDTAGGFVLQGVCGLDGPRWVAARVGLDGRATVVASTSLRAGGGIALPLGRAVVSWRGGLWLGAPDGCFSRLEPPSPEPPDPTPLLCLPPTPRVPVPDSIRSALEGGRARGLRLPDFWPPFVSASWSAAGPVLALPDVDPEGVRALLLEDGTLAVLGGDDDGVAPSGDALLLTRTFPEGTGFRVVRWSGAGGAPAVPRGEGTPPQGKEGSGAR